MAEGALSAVAYVWNGVQAWTQGRKQVRLNLQAVEKHIPQLHSSAHLLRQIQLMTEQNVSEAYVPNGAEGLVHSLEISISQAQRFLTAYQRGDTLTLSKTFGASWDKDVLQKLIDDVDDAYNRLDRRYPEVIANAKSLVLSVEDNLPGLQSSVEAGVLGEKDAEAREEKVNPKTRKLDRKNISENTTPVCPSRIQIFAHFQCTQPMQRLGFAMVGRKCALISVALFGSLIVAVVVGVVLSSSGSTNVSSVNGPSSVAPTKMPSSLSPRYLQLFPKLVGYGYTGDSPLQGWAVSLSGDGRLAVFGSPDDDFTGVGAAHIFARNSTGWFQEAKIVGSNQVVAQMGTAVAISSDGLTIVAGGSNDNSGTGAIWLFAKSGGSWSQQGLKLVGSGAIGATKQGFSVAISSDGNTVLSAGPNDNSNFGAVWVFVRTGGTWNQQGSKLVGSGATGPGKPGQGVSVALSSDGNTALIGGPGDGLDISGAAWVFTRSGTIWSQGQKLVANDYEWKTGDNRVAFGYAVGLSDNGDTAVIGGPGDNSSQGAAWVFARSGDVWNQVGSKLLGSGAKGTAPELGHSVAISGDGSTIVLGARDDNSGRGALWIFTYDGASWRQNGTKLIANDAVGAPGIGTTTDLSFDGRVALTGGPNDVGHIGAAWVFEYAVDSST